jgi:UDP-3-O-[3-hydroxymyristoyl] N-acetylglucosamine deacetylase
MKQKTIGKPTRLSGIGLHSGQAAAILLSPSSPGTGIFFLKEGKKIPATAEQVKTTQRGTALDEIAVTEHLLAAVYALAIDNLQIELKGQELPAMDGSALPFVAALEKAQIIEQNELKKPFAIEKPVKLIEKESSLEVSPYHGFKIDFMVNFPAVGEQRFSFDLQKDSFKKEIAPARTFGYIEEYELLKERGLARGASFDNALVLGKDGYINAPRFPDELVRHKILDLIGDLALVGCPILGAIKAVRSGHKLNIELALKLRQMTVKMSKEANKK